MATGGGGGGGGARRRRKAGLPGLCWKTCYFPILFWVVSVCGEEKTLIVEVGGERERAHTHTRVISTQRVCVCVCACYLHLYVPGMCRNDPPSISPSRALRGVSEWTQVYRLLARCSFVVGARTERKQKVLFFNFILLISSLIAHRSPVSPSEMLRSLSRAQLPGL